MDSFYAFFKKRDTRTRVNLHNTIVYRDIKIYRSNVKTLRFLEKLCSASATFFALCFHFFYAAQLHIGIPIPGLISIFIKCAMCQFFAQWVTYGVRRKVT